MRYDIGFVKYQGCGNDFVIKDELDGPQTPDEDRSLLAKRLTDRHFKVGADGVIFIERAPGVDGSMRLFEPAGNEADMCGNGIRCVAEYLSRRLGKSELDVLTRDGMKHIVKTKDGFRVDMGKVRTKRADLKGYITDRGGPADSMLDVRAKARKRMLRGALVNSGEPHFVVPSAEVDTEDVTAIGESVNKDKARFPGGVNISFVQTVGPHHIKIRTYERGVYGETLACGTGATASAVVALLLKWVEPGPVRVTVLGGEMTIDIADDGHAHMTGPAQEEFEGRLTIEI